MARTSTSPPAPIRLPRRRVAAAGLLVPGLAFTTISAYVALGYGGGCSTGSTPAHGGGCAGDAAGVAVVTFPAAVVCIVLAAALLRGSRWARWPAVIVGAVLATMTAAGALAGAMATGGDDVRGAVAVGIVGLVLAAVCVLPAALLTGERGAECFPPEPPADDDDEG